MTDAHRMELERIMACAVLDEHDRHHLMRLIASIERTACVDLVRKVFDGELIGELQ
jgi:hypothetical protein